MGKVGRSWQSFVGGRYSLLNGKLPPLTRNNFPLPSSTDDHNSLNSPPFLQICCGLCQILLSAANNTTHTKSYQQATTKQLDIFQCECHNHVKKCILWNFLNIPPKLHIYIHCNWLKFVSKNLYLHLIFHYSLKCIFHHFYPLLFPLTSHICYPFLFPYKSHTLDGSPLGEGLFSSFLTSFPIFYLSLSFPLLFPL